MGKRNNNTQESTMKSFNLKLKAGQSVSVANWYDTVTPESASNGDYESTGNDWRQYNANNLYEAAEQLVEWLKSNAIDSSMSYTDVLYAIDADIDYSTGAEDYNRAALIVDGPALDEAQIKAFDALVERLLAK